MDKQDDLYKSLFNKLGDPDKKAQDITEDSGFIDVMSVVSGASVSRDMLCKANTLKLVRSIVIFLSFVASIWLVSLNPDIWYPAVIFSVLLILSSVFNKLDI